MHILSSDHTLQQMIRFLTNPLLPAIYDPCYFSQNATESVDIQFPSLPRFIVLDLWFYRF